MSESFSARLSALRKQRRLTQKEAARALGVSQALLSHYENGVRECGLDFVISAADFYGVTCDYLLGRSQSKYGFTDDLHLEKRLPDDANLTSATIYRASAALRETLGDTSEEFYRQTLILYCVCIYRVLLYGVTRGRVPANWIKVDGVADFEMYVNAVDSLLLRMLDVGSKKINLKYDFSGPLPACLKTVIEAAHEAFAKRIDSLSDVVTKRTSDAVWDDDAAAGN